jgi:tetratricopeptide (TPR) repeat protein
MTQAPSSADGMGSFGMENRKMARLFNPRQFAAVASVIAGALLINVSDVAAQAQGRFRVLVPNFKQPSGEKSKNGEKLAEQLRKAINQMNTHAPVDTDDKTVKDAMRGFGLKEDEMDCIKWVQLASQKQLSQLVLCGDIDETNSQVTAKFQPIGGGEPFEVAPFAMTSPEQGAQQITQAFGTYIQQLRAAQSCSDYIVSESWQQALDACTQVTQLNPKSIQGHGSRAIALENLNRPEEALAAFQKVLEIDQINTSAMLRAGLLAAKLNQQDVSQRYFKQYLEFDPENEEVRVKIASDLNAAGDPAGALLLLEQWTSNPKASIDAHYYAGMFAASAALAIQQRSGPATEQTTQAKEFFNKAIAAFDKVIAMEPDSVDQQVLRQLVIAHRGAGNIDKAVELGRRATATPSGKPEDDAQIWSIYAQALQDAKLYDEALVALDKTLALDPTFQQIPARKAAMLISADRYQEAVDIVKAALETSTIDAAVAEQIAGAVAYKGFQLSQANELAASLPYFSMARSIARQPVTIAMANFFEGFTLVKQGAPLVSSNETTAAQARNAKPIFEKARVLLQGASAFEEQAAARAQLLGQITQYIERIDAIIKIGR